MHKPEFWDAVYGKTKSQAFWSTTMHQFGQLWDGVLYGQLFAPDTAIICNRVFLAIDADGEPNFSSVRQSIFEAKHNVTQMEDMIASFNWIDFGWLFANCYTRPDLLEAVERRLATDVCRAWKCVLAGRYPSRAFSVRIVEAAETGDSLGVEFREVS